MDNKAKKLLSMYKPEKIYENFGDVIRKLTIKGMKGTNCAITFDFPITAISGFNGAGKVQSLKSLLVHITALQKKSESI